LKISQTFHQANRKTPENPAPFGEPAFLTGGVIVTRVQNLRGGSIEENTLSSLKTNHKKHKSHKTNFLISSLDDLTI